MDRLFIILAAALFVAMIAQGCAPPETEEDPVVVDDEPAVENDLTEETISVEDPDAPVRIENFEYVVNGLARIVSGILYNPSDRNIRHAEVRVGLYDEHNQLGETIAIAISDIPAGERRNFRREVDTDVDYPRARVRDVMVVR